jgi:hypothetical protein
VNDLLEADLVIADLTDHNPNVLFELGLRMAEDKPVALIKAIGTGKVFDVDNMLRVYGVPTESMALDGRHRYSRAFEALQGSVGKSGYRIDLHEDTAPRRKQR